MSSLQAFQGRHILPGSVGQGRERLAYGMDLACMSAGRLQAGMGRETALANSVGSKLGVLEGLALHELWLKPVDGVRESQGASFLRSFRSLSWI
jgi:hypothetical protein